MSVALQRIDEACLENCYGWGRILDGYWESVLDVVNGEVHYGWLRLAFYWGHYRCDEVNEVHCLYLSLISRPDVS